MNKQEFIEKLKEHGAWCVECHDTHGEKDRYVKVAKVRELLDQLDELQDEKVEITEEQARILKDNEDVSLYVLLRDCTVHEEELLARARLNGYTVKPKRWVVKLPNDYYFSSWVSLYSLEADGAAYKFYDDVFVFDDRTKAEAVATLVDGIVDEV